MNNLVLDICDLRIAFRFADKRLREECARRYRYFVAGGVKADVRLDVSTMSKKAAASYSATPSVAIAADRRSFALRRNDFVSDIVAEGAQYKGPLAFSGRMTAFDSHLRILYTLLLAERRGALFHAAGLKLGRGGYLFPGDSGAGKTTLARIAGVEILLSDEVTGVELRGRSARVMGTPFWGEFEEGRLNLTLPLKGLFFLNRHAKSGCRHVPGDEAVARLMGQALFFTNDREYGARLLSIAARIVRRIPAFELSFDRRKSSFADIRSTVMNAVSGYRR